MFKGMLKVFVAIGILYWLFMQGKLDFGLIGQSFLNPFYIIVGGLLISLQLLLGVYRFGCLLSIKSKRIDKRELIGVQWIAQLFSTVLPGAFTSDLVKIRYVKDLDPTVSKSYILFIIFLDRLIGLNSLLFISGVASFVFFNELTKLNSSMENVIYLNIFLFIFSFLGMLLIFLKKEHQGVVLQVLPGQKLKIIANSIWSFGEYKKIFIYTYLTSVLGHLLSITAFSVVNMPFFEKKLSVSYLVTLIPLGQLAVVIPVSPGGIGVGHAAFSTLFHFINHSNGASLYNLYWFMCLIINLLGIFPFIFKKKFKSNEEKL